MLRSLFPTQLKYGVVPLSSDVCSLLDGKAIRFSATGLKEMRAIVTAQMQDYVYGGHNSVRLIPLSQGHLYLVQEQHSE